MNDAIFGFYAIAFVNGAGSSTFLLGRMAYVSGQLDGAERGRAIAMIAGGLRLAALLGPLAGGALALAAGYAFAFLVATARPQCISRIRTEHAPALGPRVAPLPALAWNHRRDFDLCRQSC